MDTLIPRNFIHKIIQKDISLRKYVSVRTRFPPEPNGYLHIGHAKSIFINFNIAKQYHGECNVRIDDTNPENESIEYINSITQDIQWLGFHWNGPLRYTSDYFEDLYNYAIELIKKGLAYVDNLSTETIREYRGTLKNPGCNSPYRNRHISENLILFSKMRHGEFKEGKACLRAKIDMTSPFMIMRDPILYRIKFYEHQKMGNKWCIYPMYDFAHCISDALEGITHSLCTLEFQDNRRLYDWILNNISIGVHPHQYEFARLNLEYTLLSKRQLSVLVHNNIVKSWDDPRMPTISGMRRRGYTASSIREFCRRIGVTKQESHVEISLLEACIRKELNKTATRAMAVINPVRVMIENLPQNYIETLMILKHPHHPEMGIRKVSFSNDIYIDRNDFKEQDERQYKGLTLGKKVRLRHSYVIQATGIERDSHGKITTIYCHYDPDTLNTRPKNNFEITGVIHWVSAKTGILAEFRLYHHLFKEIHPDLLENFITAINPDSLIIRKGFVEEGMKFAKIGEQYQFEREGYFCADSQDFNPAYPVFNLIVKLRDSRYS